MPNSQEVMGIESVEFLQLVRSHQIFLVTKTFMGFNLATDLISREHISTRTSGKEAGMEMKRGRERWRAPPI